MSRNDFYTGLDRLAAAAKNAAKDIPTEMSDRERRVVQAFLTRIPDQVEDIKSFLDDPHKRTTASNTRIIDPF